MPHAISQALYVAGIIGGLVVVGGAVAAIFGFLGLWVIARMFREM